MKKKYFIILAIFYVCLAVIAILTKGFTDVNGHINGEITGGIWTLIAVIFLTTIMIIPAKKAAEKSNVVPFREMPNA